MKCSCGKDHEGSFKTCDTCRARNKRQYVKHQEDRLAYASGRRADPALRERARLQSEAWRKRNREQYLALMKAWREANPERRAAAMKAWRKANRASRTASENRRRALKVAATISPFTPDQLLQRMQMWGGRCWICDVRAWQHVDHVKPLSRGGGHCLANLRPACSACNTSKGSKWPWPTRTLRLDPTRLP